MIVPSVLLLSGLLPLVSALFPIPASYTNGTGVVTLSPDVKLDYKSGAPKRRHLRYANGSQESASDLLLLLLTCPRTDYGLISRADQTSDTKLVTDAFDRFKDTVKKSVYTPWKFYAPGTKFEPALGGYGATVRTVTVELTGSKSSTKGEIDESYSLDLTKDGKVTIKAATANGAMYGLTTLGQLFYKPESGGAPYTNQAPVSIKDKPSYPHRGINIDISRNFEPPANIKRTIDGLAFNKINRLHIHATDSQSWPLVIPSIPELSAKAAYRPDFVWSVKDLQDVQSYAKARGIEAFIEIDSPGHTATIALSHPDLVAGYNQKPWATFCNQPPCGQVKLNSQKVDAFFAKILNDLLPRVKPYNTYYHSGGDELNANIYALDETVKSNSSAVIQPYLQRFVNNLHKIVRANGMKPMVWEEMILTWNLTLPTSDTLVQTWIDPSSLAAVTEKGYKALFGDYTHWYLDCGYGQWLDPDPKNAETPIKPPYADYCSPQKSWRQVYSYDPVSNLTATQKKLVYGGEAHLWHELTDPANLDAKLWPRASAAAEILWSGVKGEKGVTEDVTRRLADVRERMLGLGFGVSVVQVTWCLQHPGDCNL